MSKSKHKYSKHRRQNSIKPEVVKQPMSKKKKILLAGIFSVIGILVLLCSIFRIFIVSGDSMNPALQNKQICITSRLYKLERFDIVVVNYNSTQYVKRVIGLPGETIEYKENALYVNGKLVEDTYGTGTTNDFSITLKDDECYCLGDNRESSIDSRKYGAFKTSYIIGEVIK